MHNNIFGQGTGYLIFDHSRLEYFYTLRGYIKFVKKKKVCNRQKEAWQTP